MTWLGRALVVVLGCAGIVAASRAAHPPPGVRVIEVPYDPAQPNAPTRAQVTITPEPAPVPQAEASEEPWTSPFAGAHDRYVEDQAAEAEAAIDKRFIPEVAIRQPQLYKPAAKRCLTANEVDEDGIAIAGIGLDSGQIRSAIGSFLPKVAGCMPSGTDGVFETMAAFNVACDGRVTEVKLVKTDILPEPIVTCIEQALLNTPFPAHDNEGGAMFEVPLAFSG